jgi:hypothetical protein
MLFFVYSFVQRLPDGSEYLMEANTTLKILRKGLVAE